MVQPDPPAMPPKIDPITRSVVQHRLGSIVKEMGEAMLRTSYSQILNSSRDFSLAITDTRGRLIAQAEHIPVHVGALPWATRAVEERFNDVTASARSFPSRTMGTTDEGDANIIVTRSPSRSGIASDPPL